MMRSLYAGVSGLQNHQVRMDVIGNNISNVNTTGFKRGRVNFQDMISQNMQGAARPNEELGGVNPKQVGLGMTIAAIDTIHTQGSLQTTGVSTDLALQGNGFFVLQQGDRTFYTRNGAFNIDRDGTLVNPANGMRVRGWMAEQIDGQSILQTSADPSDLIIPVGGKDPARATTEVFLASNLDKRTPVLPPDATAAQVRAQTYNIDKTIYDNFGNTHRLVIQMRRDQDVPNQWTASVVIDPAITDFDTAIGIGGDGAAGATNFTLTFDNFGRLQSLTDAAGNAVTDGPAVIPVGYDIRDTAAGQEGTRQVFNLNLGTVGSFENTVTQYAQDFSTKAYRQDGYTMGYLETFAIDSNGQITGVYSNGTNRLIGQVALASFTNPGGLEKAGDNTFVITNNSGDASIGVAQSAGKGKVIAGTLEMSNVDLADAFTDMIVTQRGFQASSRTITTADQMLQELLGLKR